MSVAVDDVTGGQLAAAHLIALGHRHLAFVGDEAAAAPVHDRLTGVRKAIAEAKVDIRLDVTAGRADRRGRPRQGRGARRHAT